MAKVNRKHISSTTIDDLIQERDTKEPGFKAKVDARVAELALARMVKAARVKRGLNQVELAERSGTSQPAIARIESGKAVPKLDLLARIASALAMRLDVRFVPQK